MKYKVGLVIGRFQPFHLGHQYLIEKALTLCDKIIIGIGSAQVIDVDNPFDLQTREFFVKEFISRSKIQDRVSSIIFIEDTENDDVWIEQVLSQTGKIDVEIGDNDWTNGIFEKRGIPVVKVGHLKREILQGIKIRENMDKNLEWKTRVPEYLIAEIEKNLTR